MTSAEAASVSESWDPESPLNFYITDYTPSTRDSTNIGPIDGSYSFTPAAVPQTNKAISSLSILLGDRRSPDARLDVTALAHQQNQQQVVQQSQKNQWERNLDISRRSSGDLFSAYSNILEYDGDHDYSSNSVTGHQRPHQNNVDNIAGGITNAVEDGSYRLSTAHRDRSTTTNRYSGSSKGVVKFNGSAEGVTPTLHAPYTERIHIEPLGNHQELEQQQQQQQQRIRDIALSHHASAAVVFGGLSSTSSSAKKSPSRSYSVPDRAMASDGKIRGVAPGGSSSSKSVLFRRLTQAYNDDSSSSDSDDEYMNQLKANKKLFSAVSTKSSNSSSTSFVSSVPLQGAPPGRIEENKYGPPPQCTLTSSESNTTTGNLSRRLSTGKNYSHPSARPMAPREIPSGRNYPENETGSSNLILGSLPSPPPGKFKYPLRSVFVPPETAARGDQSEDRMIASYGETSTDYWIEDSVLSTRAQCWVHSAAAPAPPSPTTSAAANNSAANSMGDTDQGFFGSMEFFVKSAGQADDLNKIRRSLSNEELINAISLLR